MTDRPLVSFVVAAYKQERFVREAVQSALAQTYQPLEIVLSDDCSPDRTFEIVQEEFAGFRGPHEVILNRNSRNLGLAAHLNRAWDLTTGEFVVMQAGDDISEPQRTSELVSRWLERGRAVDLVCSHFAEMNEDGSPTGRVRTKVTHFPDLTQHALRWACGATGACAGYSRKLHEKYGPLDEKVMSEDWVYTFRAWVESGVEVVEQPLLRHRTHEASISATYAHFQKSEQDEGRRRMYRRRDAENQLAIAKEWLRAWVTSGKGERSESVLWELQRLVRIRELQVQAYEGGQLRALGAAAALCWEGGGLKNTARMVLRHVLRQH